MKDYVFTFGKHKGETLDDVEKYNVGYIYWCACKMEWFRKRVKREYLCLWHRLIEAQRVLRGSEEAWAWSGGRMPDFEKVYYRINR